MYIYMERERERGSESEREREIIIMNIYHIDQIHRFLALLVTAL